MAPCGHLPGYFLRSAVKTSRLHSETPVSCQLCVTTMWLAPVWGTLWLRHTFLFPHKQGSGCGSQALTGLLAGTWGRPALDREQSQRAQQGPFKALEGRSECQSNTRISESKEPQAESSSGQYLPHPGCLEAWERVQCPGPKQGTLQCTPKISSCKMKGNETPSPWSLCRDAQNVFIWRQVTRGNPS